MRLVVEEKTVFTIHELKELHPDGFEKAHEEYCQNIDFSWGEEWRDSLEDCCKLMDIDVKGWQVGAFDRSYCNLSWNLGYDGESELTGQRLATYLYNNYKDVLWSRKSYLKFYPKIRRSRIFIEESCPTGYTGDYDVLQPIRDFINKPTKGYTLDDLRHDIEHSWVKGYQGDMESQLEEDYFIDQAEANEWEFTEDGEMV